MVAAENRTSVKRSVARTKALNASAFFETGICKRSTRFAPFVREYAAIGRFPQGLKPDSQPWLGATPEGVPLQNRPPTTDPLESSLADERRGANLDLRLLAYNLLLDGARGTRPNGHGRQPQRCQQPSKVRC